MASIRRLLVSVLLVVLVVQQAHSQGEEEGSDAEEPNLEEIMTEVDTNKDGKISLEEFTSQVDENEDDEDLEFFTKVFTASDKNADGFLEMDELPAVMQAFSEHAELMEKSMADGDGEADNGGEEDL
ncbi:unnamed protein product [Polarella glacialis]|uniref:EF-hand domain-containing protein n=1 Tax=Polarella glacialis TaxID=89957 RepID=A0A813IIG5_POLGL|nr:unnamed protein product [Polarella glacialis]CAE8617270.1 unnamed protein product [Polarella glacialis]CAE8651481.1 unnamed protein product [Polarella glacialis]|mmetsp:Transcript_16505/g.26387  ORF Transcript_16505/g.26387 Transcript_16505/m.26387 type:complete len:127 (+) Transcript_16505:84-464(+)|eukprot:CAMPEP_0115075892 /NCGR_PEP_ID=MMETSP0227-20121206/16124_1 /TAXON_ID=89957 /ORGANISM="Polarella glacialis, Strain CCMP 1383" /LENGTH=126 /DNA_ID=CAMNT_0002462973 /DNA_START=58 /DNA_END=438 /DNA_ORIENTATION=-